MMKSIIQVNTDKTTALQNYAELKHYNSQSCACYPFCVHLSDILANSDDSFSDQ